MTGREKSIIDPAMKNPISTLGRFKLLLVGAILVPLMCGATAVAEQAIDVLAWGGPPATVDKLSEMRDAGFTTSFTGFGDVDATLKGLDAAKEAGVKLLVSCPQLKTDPQGTAQKLKSHPALAGYFLQDEPAAQAFPELAAWTRQIHAADPEHITYINLFPNYATPDQLGAANYQKYLEDFTKIVPSPILSFDHYPVIQSGSAPAELRSNWYENLEMASAAAKQAGVPLWAFALSTHHFSYPTPTLAHLRVQVFSDLAYGAQTIQYFTYWQAGAANDPTFIDAPIMRDGKRTVAYDRVKQVNAEIQALAPAFIGSKVEAVGHIGQTIPTGTHRYEAQSPISSIKNETATDGALVSLLAKGDQRFLVLVNRDINKAGTYSIALDDSKEAASIQRMEKDGTLHAQAGRTIKIDLPPGDVAVLEWKGDRK